MGYTVLNGKVVKTHKGLTRTGKNVKRTFATAPAPEGIYPADKGKFGGSCNRSACLDRLAVFYNYSTRKYYCAECAYTLNRVNQDANDLFGHDLCLLKDDISGITMKQHERAYIERMNQRFNQAPIDEPTPKEVPEENIPGKGWTIKEDVIIDTSFVNPKAVATLGVLIPEAVAASGGLVNTDQQQHADLKEGHQDDNQH